MVEKESGKVEGNEFGSVWELQKMKNGQKRLGYVFAVLYSLSYIILMFSCYINRYYNLITGLSAIERPTISLSGLLADIWV